MSNMLNPDAIFSNNEMSLSDIEIYGFDYDYTLVFYSKHLHTLIFNAARDLLINEHRSKDDTDRTSLDKSQPSNITNPSYESSSALTPPEPTYDLFSDSDDQQLVMSGPHDQN